MSQETETVNGTSETPQTAAEEPQKETGSESQPSEGQDSQPVVQEDACILKSSPKNSVAEITETFLQNEKESSISESVPQAETTPEPEPTSVETPEEAVPEEVAAPPQVIEVSLYTETETVVEVAPPEDEEVAQNGHSEEAPVPELLTNGNGVSEVEEKPVENGENGLNGTIASELITEDYKLPDVVEVKKNFEYSEPTTQSTVIAPPKKGALSTNLDAQNIKQAYQDVRHDGSDTQWAVFKFEGPTIVTSATGTDFAQFKGQFGDDERAFAYIRVQTGDEMSKRAKFLLVTWVGPSVSVLKRAKMSTDKAIIKDILSNFAVELQTENITDIDLQNFEAELDKAAGAHYGTGVRSS